MVLERDDLDLEGVARFGTVEVDRAVQRVDERGVELGQRIARARRRDLPRSLQGFEGDYIPGLDRETGPQRVVPECVRLPDIEVMNLLLLDG